MLGSIARPWRPWIKNVGMSKKVYLAKYRLLNNGGNGEKAQVLLHKE
jgi:hypothetical protein